MIYYFGKNSFWSVARTKKGSIPHRSHYSYYIPWYISSFAGSSVGHYSGTRRYSRNVGAKSTYSRMKHITEVKSKRRTFV